MKKKLIVGNWKMNGSLAANESLVQALRAGLSGGAACSVALAAPAPYLAQLQALCAGSCIEIAAQDVSQHEAGAYTGEVAAAMLRDFGVRYALVGHSERRQFHGESDAAVAEKAQRALAAGITPIVCVGETLAEREAGQTEAVVRRQLAAVIHVNGRCISEVVVAYEPVWAIGTGKTATPRAGAGGACGAARSACRCHRACWGRAPAVRRKHERRQCRAVAGRGRHRRWPGGRSLAEGARFPQHHRSRALMGAAQEKTTE